MLASSNQHSHANIQAHAAGSALLRRGDDSSGEESLQMAVAALRHAHTSYHQTLHPAHWIRAKCADTLLEALLSLGDWTGAHPVALESLAAMVKGCEYPYFPAFKSAGMTEKESAAMVAAAAADGVHNPVVAIRMMMVGKLMWWICGEGGDGGSATERSRLLLGARTHLECARCVLRTTHGDDSTIYRDLLGLLDQVHAG